MHWRAIKQFDRRVLFHSALHCLCPAGIWAARMKHCNYNIIFPLTGVTRPRSQAPLTLPATGPGCFLSPYLDGKAVVQDDAAVQAMPHPAQPTLASLQPPPELPNNAWDFVNTYDQSEPLVTVTFRPNTLSKEKTINWNPIVHFCQTGWTEKLVCLEILWNVAKSSPKQLSLT